MRANRWLSCILLLLCSHVLLAVKPVQPSIDTSNLPPRPNKAAVFFYRFSEWADNFVMKDLDTAYIGLPEHSWRFALTTGMVGVNSHFLAEDTWFGDFSLGNISLVQRTTPSVNLGFHAGYRGFGLGYSWDLLHAYSQNMSFSLGVKSIGIEFRRQVSSNIRQFLGVGDKMYPLSETLNNTITNTTVAVWYALNSSHYSHNAAIKQSYIQKKTAGSLLLQLSYMSTDVKLDTLLSILMGNIKELETNQVGVGLGYGINYTPNHGKVLLHLAAMAQLVCFSHNLVAELPYDTIRLDFGAERLYRIKSRYPVHVTGTVRAAVSWEINKWVHLSAWAQGKNIRFMAQADNTNIKLSNWDWTVNLAIGVRLGAGYERRQKILDDEEDYLIAEENEILREAAKLQIQANENDSLLLARAATIEEWNTLADSISAMRMQEAKEHAEQLKQQSSKTKRKHHSNPLPKWVTDFFYSPRQ